MTWATDRLDEIKAGTVEAPPVVRTLRLGLLDDWAPGWVQKRWLPQPDILNADGSMFGGYLAALADQMLTFAALSVVDGSCGFRTANLNLQFYKLAGSEPLMIEGRVVGQSRRVIAVEAEFKRENGALIAKASAQQITIPIENSPLNSARMRPDEGQSALA